MDSAAGGGRTLAEFVVAAALICGGAPGLFARGVVVSPTQLGLAGTPGVGASGIITVASSRQEQNQIRVSVGDYTLDDDGRIATTDMSDHPRSCRRWIEIDNADFVSPESGRVVVVITARIPKEAIGSYWAILRVDSIPPPRTGDQIRLALMPRVSIPVIVTASGTEKLEVRIGETRAVQKKDGDSVDSYSVVENTGNTAVLVSGAFALERVAEGVEAEELNAITVGPVTSLPGVKTRIKAKIPWKGSVSGLQVHGYFRYGPDPEHAGEAATPIEERPQ